MARIGINPARGKTTDAHPQRITVALVTYLPDLSGYFAQRLDVLRVVLASLSVHTPQPHDVMVFDNASCPEAVAFLRQAQAAGQINFLLLSDRNIGKIDALRVLFQAVPGEIIAYSDDDILFSEDWLQAHLDVLYNFPKVGMVSGVAVRNASGHAMRSLERLAEQPAPSLSLPGEAPPLHLTARRERRIPDTWEHDWAVSTGRDPQAHLDATREQLDLVFRLEMPGGHLLEAFGGANHFQFVARKERILQALPGGWTGKLMGSMVELDEAVDNLGYLRLSTARRYTRHLGNTLSPQVVEEVRQLKLPVLGGERLSAAAPQPSGKRRRHPILRLPGARRVLMELYNRLFKILYQ